MGGLAVILPIAVVLSVLGIGGSTKAWGILSGMLLLCGVGVYDDCLHIRPRVKLLLQIAAAGLLLAAGFRLPGLGVPGVGYAELGVLGYPLLVFWVVAMTNALNLIDGLDGLATSLVALAGLGLVLLGVQPFIAASIVGATLGFLPHNLPRASQFLGDGGSLPLGFLLAALVLELPGGANLPFAVALVAYPIGDVGLAFVRRVMRNKPVFSGDRSHVHHKAALHLHGDAPALLAIVAFAFAQMVIGLLRPSLLSLGLTFFAWFSLAVVLLVAGRYRLESVLAARRPYRRLHVCARYGEALLRVAESRRDVEQVLQHCVETLKLGGISIPALALEIRNGRDARPPLASHENHVRSREVRWTTPLPRASESFEHERESVMLELLRLAIRYLDSQARMLSASDTGIERLAMPPTGPDGVRIS